MIGGFQRWLKHVVFWGFIVAVIFGFAITAGTHGRVNGFAIEGDGLLALFKGIGSLLGPIFHSLTHKHGVSVH